ncbi:hypothetical protein NUU61_004471 [Penicillium alfredii]|uniref:Utp8 beta-propeller domain-containing protein n=1 Tax=Penicillium alfredii TaxID=1506179 RepID=A0A9W9FL53_9EURO|nr:uncharacterized protein NUU61_004471 [Penicillium alfredii]KAJ5102249.1 hypothetical protein NUU61_004471 [Penicillium alfredii]
MDLQTPSVLAQLPRPLHASTGKTRIGDVFSLADAKKRKRYEVAVAIDGEAVNIYNVQTPKLVTSYAVPPQSTFSCRPCSVRRKLSKDSTVKRQTYAAVNKPEHQIKCFVEEISSTGSNAPAISSSTATVADSSSPTTFVGIVPSGTDDGESTDPFDILAVHQDGLVRRMSSDLKSERWSLKHSEVAKLCSTHRIHSCFLVEFDDAKKALFKRRQDLAALALGDLTTSGAEPSILLLVSHPAGNDEIELKDVSVQMFSVPADAQPQSIALDESQRLRHLQTIHIPDLSELKGISSSSMHWNFHSGSAGLNLSFENGFLNVDLSQYSPTLTSQFVLDDERFSSIMRISPQSVIGASQSLVAVYDTQYQSVQRSIAVGDIVSGAGSTAEGPTVFISYFAKLGIAVATKGNTLIAFDLSSLHHAPSSSLKRSRDGLLIDAIGRGIGSSASQWDMGSKKHRFENMASLGLTSPEQMKKWKKLTQAVEDATKSKNPTLFDQAVSAYFRSDASTSLPERGQYVNPEATLFLLSKIFAVQESTLTDKVSASSSSQLRVVMWPPITCDWLIRLGHLSLDNVEIALRRACKPRILQSLPTGSFVQALVDSDPSLTHVNQVLEGPALISSDELAYALRIFLDQARSRSGALEETARAVTNGDVSTPTQELSRHLGGETASLKDVLKGLNTSLQKIHSQPLPTLVQSLRSSLSRTDLISMVHHLRLSLAFGGYTSRFTENPPTPITIDQITPTLSLNTIIDLITASVDAVGPSGWISALPAVNDLENGSEFASRETELIADMKSEVSAALAGVEEATYLKGILHEYLRFADQVATSATTSADALAKIETETATPGPSHLVRYEKLNGADLMVFTRPGEGEDGYDGDAGGKLLPLSLKPGSADVEHTKLKKSTGETKNRTSREIGYLRRKAVGKYSFERLLV